MKTSDYNLIEKYLDGTATPEEFVVLQGRLRREPALRLELLKEAGLESQLRVLLKAGSASAEGAEGADEVAEGAEQRLSKPRILSWRPAWIGIPLAAAAAALVAALFLPQGTSQPQGQVASHTKPAPQAKLSASEANVQPVANESVKVANTTPSARSSAMDVMPAVSRSEQASRADNNKVAATSAGTHLAQQAPAAENRMVAVNPPAPHPMLAEAGVSTRPVAPSQHNVAVAPTLVAVARPEGAHPVEGNPASSVAASSVAPAADPAADPVLAAVKPAAVVKPAVVAAAAATYGAIVSANGKVFLTRAADGTGMHPVQNGEGFQPGDQIEAGPLSGLTLRYADGSMVHLYSDTHLAINQTDQSRILFLSSGAIDLRVQPMRPGNNLVVATSYIEARVVGTEFRVMTDGNWSWVGVKSGRVQVVRSRANGEVVMLEPGYYASATKGWPSAPVLDPVWRSKCQVFTGTSRYP